MRPIARESPVESNALPKVHRCQVSRSVAYLRRRGCSSMVEQQPSKLNTRVRFPSPAPITPKISRSPSIALLYLARHTTKFEGLTQSDALSTFGAIYPPFMPARGMADFVRLNWLRYAPPL